MHRTEGAENISNLFTDGPPGTRVEQNWLNAVQEELANAIENAGLTLKTAVTETSNQLSAVFDLKANDAGVVHLAGSETITGSKTFTAVQNITVTTGVTAVTSLVIVGITSASVALHQGISFQAQPVVATAITDYIALSFLNEGGAGTVGNTFFGSFGSAYFTTGVNTPTLGSNSPAAAGDPNTWLRIKFGGAVGYIPIWGV